MAFLENLCAAASINRSWICVGLDPDLARLPDGISRDAEGVTRFNQAIIDATSDLVCAYKPNSAFYEALGRAGWDALRATIRAVPANIPVILDAKRGDIGSTARAYAEAAFDVFGAHAVTLSPYLGGDALSPFLEREDRGCFILCRTSNPGGDDLQNLELAGGERLYQRVARLAASQWNGAGNCGLVVGATYPRELAEVRALCPGMPLLVPGVGTQGGDLAAALAAGGDRTIASVSRAVLYADAGPGFAEAARKAVIALHNQG